MRGVRIGFAIAGAILLVGGSVSPAATEAQIAGTNAVSQSPARAVETQNPQPAKAESVAKGKELYVTHCLACHGKTGKGDGPEAGKLERKPGDLSQAKLARQTDGQLFRQITEGKAPMPSFESKLSESQRRELVNYVRTLNAGSEGASPALREKPSGRQQGGAGEKYVSREEHEKLKAELETLKAQLQEMQGNKAPTKGQERVAQTDENGAKAKVWKAPPTAASKRNPLVADERSLARAKENYTAQCLACHGPSGKGDGPKAEELEVPPSNLSSPTIQRQTDAELFWKITQGRTPMPSFQPKFSDRQRWGIVNYIRTLRSNPEQTDRTGTDGPAQNKEAQKPGVGEPAEHPPAPKPGSEGPQKAETDQPATLDGLGKEIKQLKEMARESFPGTTRFLLAGYGSAGFTAQNRGGDNFFSVTFNPIFLWKMSDRLLFESEFEAELEGHETSLALEMAHMAYVLNDYVTIGAGKFLNPMNYFVERQHMAWVNKLPDKPLAVYDGLLPETVVGLQVRGGFLVGSTKFGYALYVANAPELRVDTNGISPNDLGTLEFDNFDNVGRHVAVGGRVGFFPIPEFELGYGFQYAEVTPPGSPSQVNAWLQSADLSYVRDSAALKGTVNFKFQWVWSRVDSFTYDPAGATGGPFLFRNHRNGGYAQLAYRPSRLENKVIKNLEAIVRYDMLNQAGTQTAIDERRLTLGLNYWLAPSTVLKVAYELDHQSGPNAQPHDAFLVQFAIGF